jgi:hypothetical protein
MSKSTGPILAVGAISYGNSWVFNHDEDFKILLATGVAALMLAGLEKISPPLAVGIGYIALVTITFTRVNGKPSPAENLLSASGFAPARKS